MQIVGKGVDPLASGSGNAALTFVAKELLATSHGMNPSYSAGVEGTGALGGWEKSEMRTYLNNTILPLIPSNVAAAIKPVTKYTRIYNASGTAVDNSPTTDTLWIPSTREVGATSYWESSCPSYTQIFKDAASRKKSKASGSTATAWWSRTVSNTSKFYYLDRAGNSNGSDTSNSYGIAPGFCI